MSFTPNHLYFDDVEVGQEWKSHGRTITQADVVNFAGISGDYNPIHMDHHFAATTPFRQKPPLRGRTGCLLLKQNRCAGLEVASRRVVYSRKLWSARGGF